MDAQATFSCSVTQSDISPVAEPPHPPRWPAQRPLPQQRQDLGVRVLVGAQPVAELAREHQVSRKFLYPSTLGLGLFGPVTILPEPPTAGAK
jgi:hypothetical protein